MKFLCDHHRQRILAQPSQALAYWHEWMNKSSALIDEGEWNRACGYLGCSFEVAEWLLQNPLPADENRQRSIERFMVAGHQLAECFGRSGHRDMELHYLLTVHLVLIDRVKNKTPGYWLLKPHLQISLTMLNRFRNNRGSFKGFYDCCVETELYIKQCVH